MLRNAQYLQQRKEGHTVIDTDPLSLSKQLRQLASIIRALENYGVMPADLQLIANKLDVRRQVAGILIRARATNGFTIPERVPEDRFPRFMHFWSRNLRDSRVTGVDPQDMNWAQARVLLAFALESAEEQFVFLHRYGLIDGNVRTNAELGDTLAISQEAVRQIEIKCWKKIREAAKAMAI